MLRVKVELKVEGKDSIGHLPMEFTTDAKRPGIITATFQDQTYSLSIIDLQAAVDALTYVTSSLFPQKEEK